MTEGSWNPHKVSDTYKLSINDSFYREQILWSIYGLQVMKMRFTVLREPAQGHKIKKECSLGLYPDLETKIQGIFQKAEDSWLDLWLPRGDPRNSTS